MTDYHCNTTSYTYTDTGQLSTLTAPGSRTWDYDYNALGQPTQVTLPNGMYTTYGYDARNRMTQIHHHTDATTTALRLDYALDAGGNITGVSEYQGTDPLTTPLTTWAYGYDGRGRLTNAVRSDGDQSISATYTYAYDAGDNMLSKSEPFLDDFEDLNCNDWGAGGGWSASGGVMSETASAQTSFYRNNTDPDFDLRLRYKTSDTASGCYGTVTLRDVSAGNMLILALQTNGIKLMKQEGGVYSQLVFNGAATAAANTWYDLRVLCDGGTVTVWRGTNGGAMEQVLTTSTAPFSSTTKLSFASGPNSTFSYDDIRVIGSSLSNIGTTFACNAGNELTSQTQNNVTTNFAYDAWGRMTTKSRGNYTATYAWGQGEKLTAVTSNFPGEGNAIFNYGANGTRRTVNSGTFTKFRWDTAWNVINVDSADGVLKTMILPGLANVEGPNPSTGLPSFEVSDRLGSLRVMFSTDKVQTASSEYDPYGEKYSQLGTVRRRFAGSDWDGGASAYVAPYRYYSSETGRWLSRDPIGLQGGLNAHQYVGGNPVSRIDPLGLDYLTFDGCTLTWVSEKMDIIYVGGRPRLRPFTSNRRSWPANSGMPGSYLPLPPGTYHTSPSDYTLHNDSVAWGPFSYRLHWSLWTKFLGEWGAGRTGGFHIHGGTEPGTQGCIEFACYDESQSSLCEFDKMMKDYGRRIDLQVTNDCKR
jgi:RHS repeat-associated protein